MSLGDRYKLAKNSGNTAWSTDKAHRGRKIDLPKMEPTTAELRAQAKQRRLDEKAAKEAREQAKKDVRAARAAKKAARLAKIAAKKLSNKDAKPYKK